MQKLGKILSLYIKEESSINPLPQSSVEIDKNGILQDKHYHKNIEQSILITSMSSYTLAKTHQINIDFGLLGENFLVDFNPYTLKIGSQIQINNTILEITQNCTLCNHLTSIDSKLPKLLKNDRGIFAKVINGGKVNIGDTIYSISSKK